MGRGGAREAWQTLPLLREGRSGKRSQLTVEIGRSWERSQEMGWTRSPQGPKPREVCVPSLNLNGLPWLILPPFCF